MLAARGRARGQSTPGAGVAGTCQGGLSTLARKTRAARDPWDYFNLPFTEHSAASLVLLGAGMVWDGFEGGDIPRGLTTEPSTHQGMFPKIAPRGGNITQPLILSFQENPQFFKFPR